MVRSRTGECLCGLAESDDQQHHAPGHGRNPKYGRKRKCPLPFRRGVDRADVEDRLASRIRDALIRERRKAKDDYQHADNRHGSHLMPPLTSMTRDLERHVCRSGQPRGWLGGYRRQCNKENTVLTTLLVVLLILWTLGVVTSYTLGGFIHILLVIAIVMVLLRVIQGRNPLRG